MPGSDDFRNVFGFPDAALATEATILENHLVQSVESRVKWADRNEGRSIVVGIKGSGKTDLRRYIEGSDRSKSLFVDLNSDTGYFNVDASEMRLKSGAIKNALALQLLGVFSEVIPDSGTKAQKVKSALRDAAQSAQQIGKQIGLSAEINLKFATIDLSKLAATPNKGLVRTAWDEMVGRVETALAGSNKRGYILIDDVEDVFPGIELNADFLEGLARSVIEINRALGSRLHVLLFVKYGIWRYWFDHQREYDKVSSDIEMISWTPAALVDLISRRIASKRDLDLLSPSEQLWSTMFAFDDFGEFTSKFVDVCVNGPRDIIDLCNRCAEQAQGDLISVAHLDSILAGYSEAKVSEVGADFGDVYPQVEMVARQILQGSPAQTTGAKLTKLFEKKVVNDDRLWDVFKDLPWFKTMASSRFPSLMYEVGIAGIVERNIDIYAIEMPFRTPTSADEMVIHPAFRPNLSIAQS